MDWHKKQIEVERNKSIKSLSERNTMWTIRAP